MADEDSSIQLPTRARSAPEVVAPTNRVNIALPFGNVHVEESSKDLAELAAVMAEVASIVRVFRQRGPPRIPQPDEPHRGLCP
jgi:hypothetical protein